MPLRALIKKEFLLLVRDRMSAVILLVMPLLFILLLGLLLGEGFGQKPDQKLRISLVDLDEGPDGLISEDALPEVATRALGQLISPIPGGPLSAAALVSVENELAKNPFPYKTWARVVIQDLHETANIRVEEIRSRSEADKLLALGRRPAVIVFEPDFSRKMTACSFLDKGVNPFHREGVKMNEIGITFLQDRTQETAASIHSQVIQVTLLRVILPYMIGEAFGKLTSPSFMTMLADRVPGGKFLPAEMKRLLGTGVQGALKELFRKYDLTGRTWSALTRSRALVPLDHIASTLGMLAAPGSNAPLLAASLLGPDRPENPAMRRIGVTVFRDEEGSGLLRRGAARYQILVPAYTVLFAFSLVLTVGWLFVMERRQGMLRRLQAAPVTRAQVLLGKLVPCLSVSIFQGAFLLVAGKLVFDMAWGPASWPLWKQSLMLVPVVTATSFAAMGLSLFLAAVVRSEIQVALVGSLLVLFLGLVSGCLIPRELMPETMTQVSHWTPHAWALDAYRQLLLRPAPGVEITPNLDIVWQSCLVLTGYGTGFLALAWAMLRLD